MKKSISILLSSLFISGLILAGVTTTTVNAEADIMQTTDTTENNQITNVIVFKDLTGKKMGSTTVTGKNVGDYVNLSSLGKNAPKSYDLAIDNLSLQANGSTQNVTVVPQGRSRFYGVVRINDQTESGHGAMYHPFAGQDSEEFGTYPVPGTSLGGLAYGSEWKIFEVASWGNNQIYYRVDPNDWISAKDATLISTTPIAASNSVQKSDRSVVTTKNQMAYLTRKDGSAVMNRALGANTPWFTDKMALINGVKMYRVATDEWVKASDIIE